MENLPSKKQIRKDWKFICYIVKQEGYTGYQLARITGLSTKNWYRWLSEGLPDRLKLSNIHAIHELAEYFRRMFPKQWSNFVAQKEVEPV